MNISFLHKPLGFLLFVVILGVIICKPIGCTINAIETGIIKRFNSEYTTYREAEEKEKIEQAKIAEQEKKRIADEIALENAENLKRRKMEKSVDIKKIESSLKKKGHNFSVCNFYLLDGYVWACGDLLFKTSTEENYHCPVMVVGENNGNDYELLWFFKEMARIDDNFYELDMNISFPEKNTGYLSIRSKNGYMVYKTSNGGYAWNLILNTEKLHLNTWPIQRIRVTNQNICLIIFFQRGGSPESIESNDSGKSWVYKYNNREVFKTSDGGTTWEDSKNK